VIPRFQLYLFDVDGTLLQSGADICGAAQEAMATTAAPPLSLEYLETYIGRHLYDLFTDVLPGITEAGQADLLALYRRIYLARGHRSTRVYDGVAEMLERLGGRKSTATTKSSETTRNILTQFGLVHHFDHVQGTDGFPAKPEPVVIEKSLALFGVAPENVLMIGDAPADMEAGRRAGVRTCGVTWGYGKRDEMQRHQPDYWIEQPGELLPAGA
jgi:phosphoglycolate phosphatase